jgi:hypothetical protein
VRSSCCEVMDQIAAKAFLVLEAGRPARSAGRGGRPGADVRPARRPPPSDRRRPHPGSEHQRLRPPPPLQARRQRREPPPPADRRSRRLPAGRNVSPRSFATRIAISGDRRLGAGGSRDRRRGVGGRRVHLRCPHAPTRDLDRCVAGHARPSSSGSIRSAGSALTRRTMPAPSGMGGARTPLGRGSPPRKRVPKAGEKSRRPGADRHPG